METLTYAVLTDKGTVRAENQDSVLADPPVFLVADGIGGQAGGALASQAIVEEFRTLVGRAVDVEEVAAVVKAAHRRVVGLHDENPGAGSTLCALVVVRVDDTDLWMVLNVGDSRCYLVHEEDGRRRVRQVTVDHSLVQEMIDAGVLDPEEAEKTPLRNVITRAMGSEQESESDVWLLPFEPGQRLMLCSDGLVNAVPMAEIEAVLLGPQPPATACQTLLEGALGYGARDNVSVVVVDVGDGR
ncbi:protein phosphatase [Raineyella antarctica]|uniref:Protein phosphatase n=1 Tax=Raineyella antarctica TaxID=1577474 RepID=A0A1G6HAN0_9ACTN|nr:protein phosphatase 2C domain-containing protein [Raineyella antarctica]SDB90486.1 protein phosphatase [Raineyella antarctica]